MWIDSDFLDANQLTKSDVDVMICAIGYETRSRQLIESGPKAAQGYALAFSEQRDLSFEKNLATAKAFGFDIQEDWSVWLNTDFPKIIQRAAEAKRALKVCVDVSSMNRKMIATSLLRVLEVLRPRDELHILYSLSVYSEPSLSFPPMGELGPVLPYLSGYKVEQSDDLAVMMGIGYEYGRAVGIINALEPKNTVCYYATGNDEAFVKAVRFANNEFQFGIQNVNIREYSLQDLGGVFVDLENSAYRLSRTNRLIIVPMGPKVFAAITTLIGILYIGEIGIWRAASSYNRIPVDQIPSGKVSLLKLTDWDASKLQTEIGRLHSH